MISSTSKKINLNDYKRCNEEFIYGVKGIVRLPLGTELIYNMARMSIDTFIEVPSTLKVECILAVTDKRIMFIPINSNHELISFNYGDIDIFFYDQLVDKIYLLNIKNKKFLSFVEKKLVFRIYSGQKSTISKINCILKEYICA